MAQLNNLIVTGSSRFLNKINGVCTDGTAGTTKYMRQDGTWQVPPNDNTTYTLDTNGNNVRLKNGAGTVISTITAPYATSAGSATPTSHTHGNITNGGTLQTTDITIANGDKIIVTDSSDSAKIARTSISFDGSTATKCLTQKGTWESFTNNAGTVTKISTGVGLTGGDVTTTGTIKAKLKSETASTLDSTAMGSTTNRQYAVGVDKSGYLSVNIPWTDHYAWSDITSKPTTLAGYGITDAKIASGTITLGSNTITPITSHQDISGKLNKSGDEITGTLYSQTSGASFEVYSPSWEQMGAPPAHKMRFTATDTPRSGIYDMAASQWAFWKDAEGYYRIGPNGYAIQARSQAKGTTTYKLSYGVVIAYRYNASTSNATVAYISQWTDGTSDNVIYQHHVSSINVSIHTTATSIQVQNSTNASIQVIMIGRFCDA